MLNCVTSCSPSFRCTSCICSSSKSSLPSQNPDRWISQILVMAVSLFLLIFLSSSQLSSSASPSRNPIQVTYGTVLKLMHERTKCRLHSHDVPYGTGSGQQSVTGFPSVHDSNSYWIVRSQLNSSVIQGDSIKSKTIIRLQHMATRKWLHSHLHASPLSGNLEVSCFGGDGQSDTRDHWKLEIEGSGETWRQDQRVRLQHVDTGGYLHSHSKKYSRIAGAQQEVCGVRDKRPDNIWLAVEGVYLPVNGKLETSNCTISSRYKHGEE